MSLGAKGHGVRQFSRTDALVLAASEIVPGARDDLSDLLEAVGGIEALFDRAHPRAEPPESLADYLRDRLDWDRVEFWEQQLCRLRTKRPRVWMVTITDAHFPANLRGVAGRPPFLFVDGSLEDDDRRSIAIVGSRHASARGRGAALDISMAAAERNVTVVSGLARGIDAEAHTGALHAGGRTIAVMGTGIDRTYPLENTELANRIARHGSVLSQFPPGTPPTTSTFPMRNAVVSGISAVSVVVEAEERSGTKSEAEHALRQGRPVVLWEPLLGSAEWARRFAATPGVHMVSHPEDVLALLDERLPMVG